MLSSFFSSLILGAQAKVCRAVPGTCGLRDFQFLSFLMYPVQHLTERFIVVIFYARLWPRLRKEKNKRLSNR